MFAASSDSTGRHGSPSAALETLALIAYRQPVTRAEIESLRGVDCSGVLATLYARDLIEVAGKLPTVGNPHQYVTSLEFLKQFGLRSLADLPPLAEFAGDGDPSAYLSSFVDPRAASHPRHRGHRRTNLDRDAGGQ